MYTIREAKSPHDSAVMICFGSRCWWKM